MKKATFILLLIPLLLISGINLEAKSRVIKKKGIVSKVKDAAVRGFGWQLGKEGAKAVIKEGTEIAKDPKTKEKVNNLKEKVNNLKDTTKELIEKK
jgi:hypothetical protein